MKPSSPVPLLGVPFLPLTRREFFARLARLAMRGHAASVFTPNPEMLLFASRDPDFRRQLCSADLLLPDGIGVLLGARICGKSLPERVAGIDAAEFLLALAARKGLRVFLLGGKEGVAEEAARVLCERFPSLRICGTHHGFFQKALGSSENRAVLSNIQAAAPDLLFVCFGAPAQERWICENAQELPSLRLSMGLGGALDVWSGRLRRAPKLFRQCGLEWLWRALREPKRFARLGAIPKFLWTVNRQSSS